MNVQSFTRDDNQLWKTDQLTDGCYRLVAKVNQFVISATNKAKAGDGIVLQPFTGDDAQLWVIAAP